MKTITLTSKNQITIPADIVRQLGLDKRRKIAVSVKDEVIMLERQKTLEEIMAPFHASIKHKITRSLSDEELREARDQAHEERAQRLAQRRKASNDSRHN